MNSLMIETLRDEPRNGNNTYPSAMSNHTLKQEKLSARQLLIYAQKMVFARDRLIALLLGSKPGILAMAKEFIAQQHVNTKLSELINIKITKFIAVQEINFVQDTPKQLEEKLFLKV